MDCFLQAELCQHPRWNHTPAADASPEEDKDKDKDGDGEGSFFSGGGGKGKGAPRLFVVREGDVFAYGGEPPFRAFDMVEFTRELAGIRSDEVEATEDEVVVLVWGSCLGVGCGGPSA